MYMYMRRFLCAPWGACEQLDAWMLPLPSHSQVVQLFDHDRRCFPWENWLVLLVLTVYVLMYTLIKNEIIKIWSKCDVGWWVW